MAYMNQSNATHSPFVAGLSAAVDGLLTRYRQNRMIRETYNGLNALSDRDLADLGLHRSQLASVAEKAVRG